MRAEADAMRRRGNAAAFRGATPAERDAILKATGAKPANAKPQLPR
jgi:hypothetical protein